MKPNYHIDPTERRTLRNLPGISPRTSCPSRSRSRCTLLHTHPPRTLHNQRRSIPLRSRHPQEHTLRNLPGISPRTSIPSDMQAFRKPRHKYPPCTRYSLGRSNLESTRILLACSGHARCRSCLRCMCSLPPKLRPRSAQRSRAAAAGGPTYFNQVATQS